MNNDLKTQHPEKSDEGKPNKEKKTDMTEGDTKADKSGTDNEADVTKSKGEGVMQETNKFDKPKREPDPNATKTNEKSDATKKEK